MAFVIPRGIVYHDISEDIKYLFQAIYYKLDNRPLIEKFEREFALYTERKHCIAFPFARTAIYYALKTNNIPAGSEIIMPPITIKAILDVILQLGLIPIFVDIDPNTLCFDIKQLENKLNDKTKAIIITYLFGIVPNVEEMIACCKSYDVFIIEDFSQCLNGQFNNKKIGSFGHVGVYSASSIKTLDTYGGGLLVCDNDTLNDELKQAQHELLPPDRKALLRKIITDLIRNFATNRFVFQFIVFPLIRIITYFNSGRTIKHTGSRSQAMIESLPKDWFSAYTSFQAMVGLRFIKKVNKNDQQRLKFVKKIKASVSDILFPSGVKKGSNIYWQLIAYFDHPDKIQKYLQKKKIDTSTTSLEKISFLPAYPHQTDTPNADKLHTNGLFIPCYPTLKESDISYICHVLKQIKTEI